MGCPATPVTGTLPVSLVGGSRWAWWESMYRFPCRWPGTGLAGGRTVCSAICTPTGPRACGSTPGRNRSCNAGRRARPRAPNSRCLRRSRRRRSRRLFDHDLADLNDRCQIGVVGNVPEDLRGVRPETFLEGFRAVTEDVTHADIGWRCSRLSAGHALVDCVVLAIGAHARLQERHVLVTIVVVIEAGTGLVGVHH